MVSGPGPMWQRMTPTPGGGPILVVEDTDDLRELVAEVLESDGYEVLQASNGREALDVLRAAERPPCMAFVDLMMPVMSGSELIHEIQEEPALASLPVVVMTALDEANLRGVKQVLRKPIELSLLLKVADHYCCR
jgi:CheY-like chemotaxis protein